MLRIGLTGGIGSGKSTVANLFADLAVPIIDTDKIAHDLTKQGNLGYKEIVAHFGDDILTSAGDIDRRKLRHHIFDHPEERKWLEGILHPLIRQTVDNQMSQLNTPYCIVVIPLLVETGHTDSIDRILVIDTSEETQIKRTMARDNTNKDAVKKILAAQCTRENRLAVADDVIDNDSNTTNLAEQVEKLHQRYLKLPKSA